MASTPTELTPQERLAISRKAIVRHMNRHHQGMEERPEIGNEEHSGSSQGTMSRFSSGLSKVTYAARMWWHRHPASAVLELASPLLKDYARASPFKLIGLSVVAGAGFVAVKPWRMISASTLLLAAVKSSGLSNTLMTMLMSLTHSSGNADRKI